MSASHTPTRRRLDGEHIAHLATTVVFPELGTRWVTECGLVWAADAQVREAIGCVSCPACSRRYHRITYAMQRVS